MTRRGSESVLKYAAASATQAGEADLQPADGRFCEGLLRPDASRPPLRWQLGAMATVLICSLGYLACYLILPMSIGEWWYVYPRSASEAAYVALLLMPDLPRAWWAKTLAVTALALGCARMGYFTAIQWHDFSEHTKDFRAISTATVDAPRLMYLVFDHSGSRRRASPFIHMPAWIQAEKGGWLSFHMVNFGHSPIRYRREGQDVPPKTPTRWEWTPERFRLQEHGAFFNEFLVRKRQDPARLFRGDPSIRLVASEGSWWLFRREQRAGPSEPMP